MMLSCFQIVSGFLFFFIKNHVSIGMWIYACVFHLISSSIYFMPIPCCLYHYSLVAWFEVRYGENFHNSFTVKAFFVLFLFFVLCQCVFPQETENFPFYTCEKYKNTIILRFVLSQCPRFSGVFVLKHFCFRFNIPFDLCIQF